MTTSCAYKQAPEINVMRGTALPLWTKLQGSSFSSFMPCFSLLFSARLELRGWGPRQRRRRQRRRLTACPSTCWSTYLPWSPPSPIWHSCVRNRAWVCPIWLFSGPLTKLSWGSVNFDSWWVLCWLKLGVLIGRAECAENGSWGWSCLLGEDRVWASRDGRWTMTLRSVSYGTRTASESSTCIISLPLSLSIRECLFSSCT